MSQLKRDWLARASVAGQFWGNPEDPEDQGKNLYRDTREKQLQLYVHAFSSTSTCFCISRRGRREGAKAAGGGGRSIAFADNFSALINICFPNILGGAEGGGGGGGGGAYDNNPPIATALLPVVEKHMHVL